LFCRDYKKVYNYHYDQLNRIVAMDVFNGLAPATGTFTPVNVSDYRERISYDPNGNILTYNRHGDAARLSMDSLSYFYTSNTNRLHKVTDAATDAGANYNLYNDIKQGQADNNYQYDAIGNMVVDASETITNISWNVYDKITSITKSGAVIRYVYDASGNRIMKQTTTDTTVYVRDASGNVLSVYRKPAGGALVQTETHLYGSSRLGMATQHLAPDTTVVLSGGFVNGIKSIFARGEKLFELSNHLGNVLVTVSDRKIGVSGNGTTIDYYVADVLTANDYYPGGMLMPGRKFNVNGSYRYGFNGAEKANEIYGEESSYDFGDRIQDPRIVRWLSLDPLQKKYPGESNYGFVSGNPILYKDVRGRDKIITITIIGKDGTMTQIQKIDKNYFLYRAEAKYYGGYYYTKRDVKQHLIIDLRNATPENIESNQQSIVSFTEEETNIQDITWWEYSLFSDAADWIGNIFTEGDNSNKIAYGYRIYGRGHDMEWQSGLPQAAPGTESVDLEDWFGLASNISPNSSPAEMFEKVLRRLGNFAGKDMEQVLEALNIITKNTEAISESIVKTLDLIERFKELSKNLPKGQAVCPKCENVQDSTHIDEVNDKGTFDKLRPKSDSSSKSPSPPTDTGKNF
jgi:RHS repeat-associated protein